MNISWVRAKKISDARETAQRNYENDENQDIQAQDEL